MKRQDEGRLRIAYVCADPGVPVLGSKGASIHVREFLLALAKLGAKVDLLASTPGGELPTGFNDVELHHLFDWPRDNRGEGETSVENANRFMRSTLKRLEPFDIVYERYSLWSYAAMEYASSEGVPGLLEVNAPLIEEQEKYRGLIERAGAEQVASRVFGAASKLFAVSNGVAKYLDRFPEANGKVHVVHNGVNPSRFPENIEPSKPCRGTFTVGFVGSLKPWHGLNFLVDAFMYLHEKAPNTRLLIVGDGPERENLMKNLAAKNLIESTELAGAVAPSEIPALLSSMDVGVAPYPMLDDFYFSPLKVYEYMAAGLPVVASEIGDLSELIENEVTGFLVQPGDAVALAAVLDRLKSDPAMRAAVGHAARSKVFRSHTWDKIVRKVLSLGGIAIGDEARSFYI